MSCNSIKLEITETTQDVVIWLHLLKIRYDYVCYQLRSKHIMASKWPSFNMVAHSKRLQPTAPAVKKAVAWLHLTNEMKFDELDLLALSSYQSLGAWNCGIHYGAISRQWCVLQVTLSATKTNRGRKWNIVFYFKVMNCTILPIVHLWVQIIWHHLSIFYHLFITLLIRG